MMVELAAEQGLLVGAAGTHPFARWEEQAIVDRPALPRAGRAVSATSHRRELIFGTHVHVAIDGADRAIYVADGIRRYLPLLLALSTNSPFWRGHTTGMMSARVPVFRAFPREGIPPHYGTWEIYSHRVGQMIRAGAIEDYTYLWWDVRPHPKLGTVETRICDQQTSLESTLALAALIVSLAHRLSDALRLRGAPGRVPDRADRRQQGARRGPRDGGRACRLPRRRIPCLRPSSRSACSRSSRTTRTSSAARTTSRPSGRSSGMEPVPAASSPHGSRDNRTSRMWSAGW